MEVLIDKEYVASKLQVAVGYEDKTFDEMFVREAQQLDLKPLLCESFYCDLLEKKKAPVYRKLIKGGSYEHEGKKCYFEGLGTVISYFAYARFVLKSNIVSTTHGFMIKETEWSEPLPLSERKNFYYIYRKDANYFFEEVKIYVSRHKEDYPSWHCDKGCHANGSKSRFSVSQISIGD